MGKEKIADFYDQFAERQLKTGANARLLSLFERLLDLGLQPNSTVLELGCGVGLFTQLLAKKIKSGNIEAVDLSDESIAIGKKHLQRPNIRFCVGDVVQYQPITKNFDFITLLDVIEHIPLEEHGKLFHNLAPYFSEKTRLLINIPNPDYIAYLKIHQPESLQIIDQSVHLLPLLQHFDNENLEIEYFEKYGIWEVEDYHVMVVRKKRPFTLLHLSDLQSISEKIKNKFTKTVKRLRY